MRFKNRLLEFSVMPCTGRWNSRAEELHPSTPVFPFSCVLHSLYIEAVRTRSDEEQ
jgi:hypothetical protein